MAFIAVLAWIAWAAVSAWVLDNPRGDPVTGLLWRLLRVYARTVHRMRVEGAEHVPPREAPGPLVVVCNHTAGVDPLLVLAAVDFDIRWMMGLDMMLPRFRKFWEWAGIIGVSRGGREGTGAREALRHLARGGVLGVFPEGRIERPAGTLLPFHPGVGYLISRTGARVLPVLIRGTPDHRLAWGSLWMTSHAVVRFGSVRQFERGARPEEIVEALRGWFKAESGWRDSPPLPPLQFTSANLET